MKSNLRRVGGSTMVALQPAYLYQLQLKAGSSVEIKLIDDKLVISPSPKKPKYTLAELIAKCDLSAEQGADQKWIYSAPFGKEQIKLIYESNIG